MKLNQIIKEREVEENDNVIRVMSTHPGVELVHFCVNDLARKRWQMYLPEHPMGEVLFWYFVAPLIIRVQEIAGCEYAFLFAADVSEDGSLVNYYDVALNFHKKLDIGTNKPFYDFCCDFMCQELDELKCFRDNYFNSFNKNADDTVE